MNSSHAIEPAQAAAELTEALSKLETAMITPVVSGELESWARTAQEAAHAVSERLPAYLKSVLHPQYAEIAHSDAELLARVQKMIAEDQSVLLEQDAFRTRMSEFVKLAAAAQKDEARVAAQRAKLEQEGLALIMKIKRQRTAADTWLTEANYRDRGPVD